MSGLKLNIGSGWAQTPSDWVNIDNSSNARLAKYPLFKKFLYRAGILSSRLYDVPWPSTIHVLDVTKGLPFHDNSAACVFSSHFFEHIEYAEVKKLLSECYRVLIPGGVIRIIVPDLEAAIEAYSREKINGTSKQHEQNDEEQLPANKFLSKLELFDRHVGSDGALAATLRAVTGSKNTHKWMYDELSLSILLRRAHFKEIQRMQYGSSRIAGIAAVENPQRHEQALCLEATKPTR